MFYVYVHRKASDNSIFYVGKGCKYRAWKTQSRNKFWNNVVDKHGLTVEVVVSGLTEKQAFEIEKDFISFYGRRDNGSGCLVNLSDGGEGTTGYIPTKETIEKIKLRLLNNHPTTDKTIYTFYNLYSEEKLRCTRLEFSRSFSDVSMINMIYNEGASRDGWIIEEVFDYTNLPAIMSKWSGEHNSYSDKSLYDLFNIETEEKLLAQSRSKMKALGINASELILGNLLSSNGWSLISTVNTLGLDFIRDNISVKGLNNPRADKTIYNFIHCSTLEEFNGTRYDFELKYKFRISDLINRKDIKTYRGWALKENFLKYNLKSFQDDTTYLFEHLESCTIIEATRKEFKTLTGCDPKFFFKTKAYKVSQGWTLLGKANEYK